MPANDPRNETGEYENGHAEQARPGTDLPGLSLTHASGAVATIYLQGAHVATWKQPEGEDILFLSRLTERERGVPIRGGIPLVFPQFSDRGSLPKHGFARTLPWELVEHGGDESGAVAALMRMQDTEATRRLWPNPFLAEYAVRLDHALSTTLRVTNTGSGPLTFTCALHTYYRVGDVRTVSVRGLEGSRYLGVEPGADPREVTSPLRIEGETDGVYAGVADLLHLVDPSLTRTLVIEKEGFADTVVWNPWKEKARALPDFDDEEYLVMLCVEPANIATPIRLAPGQTWSGRQRISVKPGVEPL